MILKIRINMPINTIESALPISAESTAFNPYVIRQSVTDPTRVPIVSPQYLLSASPINTGRIFVNRSLTVESEVKDADLIAEPP